MSTLAMNEVTQTPGADIKSSRRMEEDPASAFPSPGNSSPLSLRTRGFKTPTLAPFFSLDHCNIVIVYAAFITREKKSSKWCTNHLINFKAMSRALSIRPHLERYLVKTLGLTGPSQLPSCLGVDGSKVSDPNEATIKIRKCLVSGYFVQAAKIAPDGTHWISALEARPKGARALSYTPTKLWMHPTSILFKQTPQWVIFHEVVETGKGKAYMREVTAIESKRFVELALHLYIL